MKKTKKLVRDNIPEIIVKQGYSVKAHILNDDEYVEELLKKLIEESEELYEDRTIEECADVYEVFNKILETLNFSLEDVKKVANEKKQKKGGFEYKIFLDEYIKK